MCRNFSVKYFKAMANDDTQAGLQSGQGGVKNMDIASAATLGIDPSFTETAAIVTAGVINTLRSQVYFDCEVVDDITGQPIFIMQRCKYSGGNGTTDARGVYTGTMQFKATRGFGV